MREIISREGKIVYAFVYYSLKISFLFLKEITF